MEGDYHYKHENNFNGTSRFGISEVEGRIEDHKGFIASIELIKVRDNILLLDNPRIEPRYRVPDTDYIQRIVENLSRKFEPNERYDGLIGIMEGESPRDKAWSQIYRICNWKHFSRKYPYWIAKNLDLRDKEQIRETEKIIKNYFSFDL